MFGIKEKVWNEVFLPTFCLSIKDDAPVELVLVDDKCDMREALGYILRDYPSFLLEVKMNPGGKMVEIRRGRYLRFLLVHVEVATEVISRGRRFSSFRYIN